MSTHNTLAEHKEPLYLIWSRKRGAWWKSFGKGYTTDRTQAGRYTQTEAQQIERQSAYGHESRRSVAVSVDDATAVTA